ncbi:response regulator [Kiloniella laminariae]|uniref:Response regulator n=1 Tax=Kiloniella laminariae TaxID=454162 RepID=A0ABT4LLA5_9PROT|nr:response regulator [Kiloniella laminariae]MCZ4281891.1 response regulator [Kiloniella laminariae]
MDNTLEFEPIQFLVVEDNEYMQKIVKTILATFGAKDIHIASSGKEALQRLSLKIPDIIIIDWAMKPMSGIDLVKAIRASKNPEIAKAPILMLTGHSERENVEEAVGAGINDFLVKPVSPLLLYKRIEHILKEGPRTPEITEPQKPPGLSKKSDQGKQAESESSNSDVNMISDEGPA